MRSLYRLVMLDVLLSIVLLVMTIISVSGCGIRVQVPDSQVGQTVEQAEAKARTAEVVGASAAMRAKTSQEEADALRRQADDLKAQAKAADVAAAASQVRADAAEIRAYQAQVRGWALAGGIVSAIGLAVCVGLWIWAPFGKTIIAAIGSSFGALASVSAFAGILAPAIAWGPWIAVGLLSLLGVGLAALVILAIRRLHQAGVVTASQWSTFAANLPPDARQMLDKASYEAQPAHLRPLITAFLKGG